MLSVALDARAAIPVRPNFALSVIIAASDQEAAIMWRLVAVAVLLLAACGGAAKPSARLNGTWEGVTALGDPVTMALDFNQGTLESIALGRTQNRKLSLVSELGNTVVFKIDDLEETSTVVLQGDDTLTMTSGTGTPITFQRVK